MIYEIILSPQALEDAAKLKRSEPKAYKKLIQFVEDENLLVKI